jgi:NADPH-dependent glutamate synthase beta subunit-like oxidoreductase/coenzyme F420-reducing hydrogenase delta subunit
VGIPDYRLPKSIVDREIEAILSLGIEVRTEETLGHNFTLTDLQKNYQAIFIAIGTHKSAKCGVPGENLAGIFYALEFLREVNLGKRPEIKDPVIVIGGGHTAIDAARVCRRLGASRVRIAYRRSAEEMPAGKDEIEEAQEEGVRIDYLIAPTAFLGDGRVRSAQFIRMKLGEPDDSGRRRPLPIADSEFSLEAGTVILAIGQAPDSNWLAQAGLNLDRRGRVLVESSTYATNLSGVFAGGDVVTGPASVIEAIAAGRRGAFAIHTYLQGLSVPEIREEILPELSENIVQQIIKKERQKMIRVPVAKRIRDFKEVELRLTERQALEEAFRCLNCGTGARIEENCAACLTCVRVCPYRIPRAENSQIVIDPSECQACGICQAECPAAAITMAFDDLTLDAVREVVMKAKESSRPLIVGFYCRYALPDTILVEDTINWLGRFCTGRVTLREMIYPFELGADGVVVSYCSDKECRFREGRDWLMKRVDEAKEFLRVVGLEEARLAVVLNEKSLSAYKQQLMTISKNSSGRTKDNGCGRA